MIVAPVLTAPGPRSRPGRTRPGYGYGYGCGRLGEPA